VPPKAGLAVLELALLTGPLPDGAAHATKKIAMNAIKINKVVLFIVFSNRDRSNFRADMNNQFTIYN